MGNLNEIQKQTTQSYGDNSFTTTIKENTVEFDSAKDSFTFNDEVNVPSLKVNGQEITPSEPQVQADWNQNDSEAVDYIKNKPTIPSTQVQADWNQTTSTGSDYIKNKPSIKAGQGMGSISEGIATTASGDFAHTEGYQTTASGRKSHAEGGETTASGEYSHAEGRETTAKNRSQHTFGEFNVLDPSTASSSSRGTYIEIAGNGTDTANRSNARTLDWQGNETLAGNLTIGGIIISNGQQILPQKQADWNQTTSTGSDYIKNKPAIKAGQGANSIIEGDIDNNTAGDYSHAEGQGTQATGLQSHAEGSGAKATGDYSHAEGYYSKAEGDYSHAEGSGAKASGDFSHAEGKNTTASGFFSHAEGHTTTASGPQSHAEGSETTASGDYSHTEGKGTKATHKNQHVFGEYNIVDPSTASSSARGNYVEIVGNGTTTMNRSNVRTLDWSGNEVLAGTLTIGGASGATLKVEGGALKVSFNGGTTWLTVSAS